MDALLTGLFALALAFPAGWLACRAWLGAGAIAGADAVSRDRLHALLKAQRARYRRRVLLLDETIRRHELAREQIRGRLAALQKAMATQTAEHAANDARLAAGAAEIQRLEAEVATHERSVAEHQAREAAARTSHAAADELGLMRIERDELSARLRRLEQQNTTSAPELPPDTARLAVQRAMLGELREQLATRDHRIRALEARLADRERLVMELERLVQAWKVRVAPLARQLRLQRELLRRPPGVGLPGPAPTARSATPDNLRAIRGIGPALERRLRDNGIQRFAQLAELRDEDTKALAARIGIAPGLPVRDRWVEQAQALAQQADAH
jgi:hypothetical protein